MIYQWRKEHQALAIGEAIVGAECGPDTNQ
jgi:hypothetical protein